MDACTDLVLSLPSLKLSTFSIYNKCSRWKQEKKKKQGEH